MESARTVLVVDDEPTVRDIVGQYLGRDGFRVVSTGDGREVMGLVELESPDLVVLDVMLPGFDGLQVMARLRQDRHVPVILLTARGEETDRIVGLEIGADDYVTKPFSTRELVARIRAVLRRRGQTNDSGDVLESAPVRLDADRHVVTVGGELVSLPLKEFELLEMLLRNTGRVLTRGQLIDRIWGADYVGDTKTLDVHVKRLRSKLEKDPSNPQHLVTVRGLGYKFEA